MDGIILPPDEGVDQKRAVPFQSDIVLPPTADPQIAANLRAAVPQSADKAAQALTLSSTTGYPLPSVQRNLDQIANEQKVADIQYRLAANPVLAAHMRDPTFAEVTHDDTENLATVEGRVGYLANRLGYLGRAAKSGVESLVGTGAKLLDKALDVLPFGTNEEELAVLFKDQPEKLAAYRESGPVGFLSRFTRAMQQASENTMAGNATPSEYRNLEYATTDPAKAAYLRPLKVAADAIQSLPTMLAMAASAYLTKGVMTRVEAEATAAGMAPEVARKVAIKAAEETMARLSATTEGAVGYAQQAMQTREQADTISDEKLQQSPEYQKLIGEGFTPETARAKLSAQTAEMSGAAGGVADAAFNFIGGKYLGHIIGEGGNLLPSIGKGFATEALEEGTQSAFEQLGQNTAVKNFMNPQQELLDGVAESIAQGFVVGGVSGGGFGGVFARGHQAQQAEEDAKNIKELLRASHATLTLPRSPQTLSQFVNAASENGPINAVYVDAEAFAQGAIKAGIDIAKQMPATAAALQDALDAKTDVRIPLGELASAIPGTTLEQPLIPLLRTSVDGPTQAEVADKQWAEETQKQTEKILAEHDFTDAWKESTNTVREQILAQLTQANRFTADVNKAYAAYDAAFYATQAHRLGMTPEEMYVKYARDHQATGFAGDNTLQQKTRPAISVTGVHFSKEQRAAISTEHYGTGMKDAAFDSTMKQGDQRLKQRAYFYVPQGKGVTPESEVGAHAHVSQLDNLYDAKADPLRLAMNYKGHAFESAVLDKGYNGYYTRDYANGQGAAVVLGPRSIKTKYAGDAKAVNAQVKDSTTPDVQYDPTMQAALTIANDKRLPAGEMTPKEWRAQIEKVAPDLMAHMSPGVFVGTKPIYKDELARRVATQPAHVNIGLDIPGGGAITPREAINALQAAGVDVVDYDVQQSNTEQTLVAKISRSLTPQEAHDVSVALQQQSIAQIDHRGVGDLHGPGAAQWRPFNPDYFLTLSGDPASNMLQSQRRGNGLAQNAAITYMHLAGLPYTPPVLEAKVDVARAKRIAEAYEAMKHDPENPEVKAAYAAMVAETNAQWQVIKATGLKVEFIKPGQEDPYAKSPRMAIDDVSQNNHLWVFPTDQGFGSDSTDVSGNPLLAPTGETVGGRETVANDIFRIVHDYFGHVKDGNGFRANGEENAWRSHASMYSPLARRAMTTETRGQNSWVNYGPHGEANRVASSEDTHFAPQKTGLLPEWVSNEGVDDGSATLAQRQIKNITPAIRRVLKHLTPAEKSKIGDAMAAKIVEQLEKLPKADEMAAIAHAGRAKRGWYSASARAISDIFGPDAPRFASLLAALSPQTSVESNLRNALNVWNGWIKAGRPTEREDIIKVMAANVEQSGDKGGTDSVLPAWINNSVRALSDEDVLNVKLSGPKVESFYRNLIGETNEITLDTWMANYALVEQTLFGGSSEKTPSGMIKRVKGSGYIAYNARVREAAARLTKYTGEEWTPAEVQETIWSWAKSLYELAEANQSTAVAELKAGTLTHALVNSTADFSSLFTEPEYAGILEDAGYGEELNGIRSARDATQRQPGEDSVIEEQAGPFAEETQRRFELAAAKRLDRLKERRNSLNQPGNTQSPVEQFGAQLSKDHPGVTTILKETPNGTIELYGIQVEGERGVGTGSAAMRDLVKFADEQQRGVMVMAYPEDAEKMPLAELTKWYEKFGFVPLSEQEYSDATMMYRDPKGGQHVSTEERAATQRGAAQGSGETPAATEGAGQVNQPAQNGNRASITFNPGQRPMMTLGPKSDLSSFLHEAGHHYLEILADIARQPDAPADIVADFDTVLKWFGVTRDQWYTMTLNDKRKYHEQWARGNEAYLFEGKAPSAELQPIFGRFRAWMISVYQHLIGEERASANYQQKLADAAGEDVNLLTDEVRAVMDRLLATNEEIVQAETARNFEPMFDTKPEGMSEAEWADYQSLGGNATQEAVDQLQTRSLRDMQWLTNARSRVLKKLQASAAEKRKGIRAEVAAEVDQQPLYAAAYGLRNGWLQEDGSKTFVKFNTNALKEMYPESMVNRPDLERLQGMTNAETGLDPDAVAQLVGFTSGDELIRKLTTMEPRVQVIEGITDQRMLERYGDLADPASIAKAADEAVHNEARVKFVATELRMLNKATGQKSILTHLAKNFAQQFIARKKIKDISPAVYAAAETRAAKNAEKARIKGDLTTAAGEKRNQLVNLYSTKAAYDALDEVEKAISYLKRVTESKTIDPEYREQIAALLERFELKSISNKTAKQRESLVQWIASQREKGMEPVIDPALENEANRKPYREMPLEDFRGLVDAVRNIEHLGRLKHKLLKLADQREFQAVVDELAASIEKNAKHVLNAPLEQTKWVKIKSGVQEFFAMHRKFAFMGREMDGNVDNGAFWNILIRPMNEAGDNETVMREQATIKLEELLKPISKLKMSEKIFIPEIRNSLSREGRIMVALNTGNEGNLQRLMDGDHWTIEQVQAVVDTLTKGEMDFVQSIWDFVGSYRAEIGAQQKRLTGVEPEWIEPRQVVTQHGVYKGGYLPAKYDTTRSTRSLSDEAAAGVLDQWRAKRGAAKTRDSFTKGRAKAVVDRPLRKDLGVVFQHITEVTHRLAWQEYIVDANRLLRASAIDNGIREHYGPEVLKALKDAIEDIAAGEVGAQNSFERGVNYLRMGATIAGLGWRLTTSLLQPIGLTQSMVRIGPKWVGQGLVQWLGDAAKMENTAAMIFEKSPMMRLRAKTMQREISEIRNQVSGENSAIEASYFYAIQKMQLVADIPTWLGQYNKAVHFGADEKNAIAQADQAVLDAQGGGQVKDLAAIQRGGPLLKLFTNFYSFFNTTYNLTSDAVGRTKFKDPLSVGRLAVDMLLLYSVPAVLGTLLKAALHGGDDGQDEKKLLRQLIADQLTYMFGTMVGLRETAGALQTAAGLPGDYQGPASVRIFAELAKLGKQVNQGEVDEAALKAAANVGGILFHLPSGQVTATLDGVAAMAEGKTKNPGALLVGSNKN